MAIFKDHNTTVKQLLGFIPEALLTNLSLTTRIDHYAKVLQGNKLFYLLLYGILDNDRLSQRTLEDTFNDSVFKMLFNLDEMKRYAEVLFLSDCPRLILTILNRYMIVSTSNFPGHIHPQSGRRTT